MIFRVIIVVICIVLNGVTLINPFVDIELCVTT
jgi:hypothetical protein